MSDKVKAIELKIAQVRASVAELEEMVNPLLDQTSPAADYEFKLITEMLLNIRRTQTQLSDVSKPFQWYCREIALQSTSGSAKGKMFK